MHIEHLPLVLGGVGDVASHTLSVRVGGTHEGDEEEAGQEFHRLHPFFNPAGVLTVIRRERCARP
jgi:hypothetical protein